MNSHLLRIATLLLVPLSAFAQGPLNPPSGPAATMRALDQIEPRTPIDAAHTPGDADSVFRIVTPGSYYLTGDIVGVSGKSGIEIASSDVTIDLSGFRLAGVPGSLDGIGTSADVNVRNVRIHNGTVTRWGAHGINLFNSAANVDVDNTHLEHLRVSENAGSGIRCSSAVVSNCVAIANAEGIAALGNGATITNCAASGNTGDGIFGFGSAVSHCTANRNGGTGIKVANQSSVTNCVAFLNGGDGFVGANISITGSTATANGGTGFKTSFRCTLTGCVAIENGTGAAGAGISASGGATIVNCSANDNRKDGITVGADCLVAHNVANSNGSGATDGAGIRAEANGNRIQGNNVTGNDIGIRAGGTGNLIEANHVRSHTGPGIQVTTANGRNVIIRNVAGENVNSYTGIAAGNDLGPVTTVANATHPLGNIQN